MDSNKNALKRATNFSCRLTNGMVFELAHNLERGEVLLIFIKGPWDSENTKHIKTLQDLIARRGDQIKSSLLVISDQKLEFVRAVKAENDFTAMMASDREGIIARAFGASDKEGIITIVINQSGEIESRVALPVKEKTAS